MIKDFIQYLSKAITTDLSSMNRLSVGHDTDTLQQRARVVGHMDALNEVKQKYLEMVADAQAKAKAESESFENIATNMNASALVELIESIDLDRGTWKGGKCEGVNIYRYDLLDYDIKIKDGEITMVMLRI